MVMYNIEAGINFGTKAPVQVAKELFAKVYLFIYLFTFIRDSTSVC